MIKNSKEKEEQFSNAISSFSSILSRASEGDLTAMVDLSSISEEYREIGEKINQMIEVMREHEKRIKETKILNDLIVDSSTVPIVVTDRNWKWIKVNPAFEELFGYKGEEILGKTGYEIPIWTAEECQKATNYVVSTLKKEGLRKHGELEARCKTKDGRDLDILLMSVFLKKEASKNVGGISYLFDITNLRELEKELRESRQCYYDLVEGVNSVVMRMNVNGTITFINKFAEEFFGYSRDELIGQNLVGKIVPKMESTGRDLEEMILEIGKNPEKYRNNINENMRKNGERVWVLWTNRPVPDEQGHVVEVICIGNDITEQKKTAEALRRSEEKYRVTFENTGTAMAVLEEDMAISLINSQFEKLSRYSKEEIEGKVKWPLLVHKEELKRMEEYHRKRRENPDEVPKEYEFKGVIKNGNVRELLITIDIIPGTKKSVLSLIDITERKRMREALQESEEKYRGLINTSTDAVISIDPQMKITLWNPAAGKLFGYTEKEMLGQSLMKIVPERYRQRKEKGFSKYVKTGSGPVIGKTSEFEGLKKDGTEFPVEISISSQKIGETYIATAIVRDIAERKRMEQALRRLAELERLVTTISTNFINLAPDEIDDGINQALQTIGEFASVDRSYIFLLSEDGKKASNTHEWCAEGIESQMDHLMDLPAEAFPWGERLYRFETIYIPRVADIPPEATALKEILQPQNIQSLVLVPMVYGGSLVGCLGFDSVRSEKTWPEEITVLLKIVGEIFANALERKRADQALRESEERFRAIFVTAQDSIFIKDRALKYIQVNPAMERLFGLPASKLIGLTDKELFGGEAGAHIRETDSRVLGGEIIEEEHAKPVKGSLTTFHTIKVPMRDASGEIIGICGIARDITERKRGEEERKRLIEELEASKIYFQNFFDSSPVPLTLIGLGGKRLDCNPAMERLTGKNKEELINVPVEATYLKEEQPLVRKKLVDETIEKGYMYGFETYFMRPDGAKLPIVANCSLLRDKEGTPSDIIYSAADITELRNREEELKESDEFNRLLVENLPVGIWMADEEGRCYLANKELTRLLGWEKEELVGKQSPESPYVCDNGLPYMEEGTVEALTRIWKKTIENREHADGEVPFRTKDGRIVIHKGVEIPYGKGKSRLWASTDITKLKKREEELEETKNYLEAARSSISEMLYTFNTDGVTTYINPAFTQVTGFTEEDMIGKSIDEWPALPPDTKPLIAARVKQRVKTGEPITNVETELITKSGKRFPIRYSAAGIRDKKGTVIGEVVVATDVTEVHRRREEIRAAKAYTEAIIANISDPLWVTDKEDNWILVNEAMKRITGSGEEELLRKKTPEHSIFKFFLKVPGGREKLEKMRIKTKKHVTEIIPWVTKDDRFLMMSCSGEPLVDAEGNRIGGVFVGKEISTPQRAGTETTKALAKKMEIEAGENYELATLLFMTNAAMLAGDSSLEILKSTVDGYNKRFDKNVKIRDRIAIVNMAETDWPHFIEFLIETFYQCIGPTTFECVEGIRTMEEIVKNNSARWRVK